MSGVGRLLAIVASIVMFAAVLGGFHVLGSPAHQRDLRLDTRRVQNLTALSMAIRNVWMTNHTLPADLDAIDTPIRRTVDPVTGKPYGYRRLSDETYNLCAEFAAASEDSQSALATSYYLQNLPGWKHPAGLYCYTFNIKQPAMPEP
jgi:hypothetical protein